MKTKIQRPNVSHYNIADHTEFHETLYKILDTNRALIDDDSLLVRYQMAETEENYIYKWMRKSELRHYDPTARKQEKDGSTSMVKLVFTQDYQISYVNNVNPGTATILIAGIGKYTGNTDVRFNIVKGLAQ
jgi:hypothetical protein